MLNTSSASALNAVRDAAECRALLRGGSRTFHAASLVLPETIRGPATALYAFCRMADDAIDQSEDGAAGLRDLRLRLDLVYQNMPDNHAADRAFADVVCRYSIPKAFPMALLEGFAWDAETRQYESFAQLKEYAVRVAGTVGLMMAMVMGVRDRLLLARACDLGVAMQLTNIARDVGEDAGNGRLYLPLEWMRDANLDPRAWLANPLFNSSLAAVIRRLLTQADVLYQRSEAGIAELPSAYRPSMYAARLLYAEIGNEVARRNFDSVTQRAIVSWPRKVCLVAQACAAAAMARARVVSRETLTEGDFLINPLAFESAASVTRSRWPRLEDRMVWLIDLFERLERLERSHPNPVSSP